MLSPLNRKILTVVFSWLICGQVFAFDLGPVEIHGYAASGYYRSFGNNVVDPDSKDGSIDFYEAALNYNYSKGRWFTLGQVISRDIGEMAINEESLALDYLLLGANMASSSNFDLQFRLGQIKTPYGTIDTSDIPTTRNSPLEGALGRNLYLRSRGIVFDATYMSDIGDFDINLGILRPEIDGEKALNLSSSVYYVDHEANYNPVLRFKWTSVDRGISVTYSSMHYKVDHSFNEEVPFQTIHASVYGPGSRSQQLSLDLLFDSFKVIATIGNTETNLDWKLQSSLGPIYYQGPVIKSNENGYSIRGIYDFTSKLAIGSAISYSKTSSKVGQGAFNSSRQKSVQFTLDYDFNESWSLKSAISHNIGADSVLSGYNPDGKEENWELFEFQVTYSF